MEKPGIALVPNRIARPFIERHHYLHRSLHMGQLHYGLYDGDQLNGVLTFGYPAFSRCLGFHGLDYLEFARCVTLRKDDPNLLSWAVARVLDWVARDWACKYPARTPILLVVSYADLTRHTGGLYRACNFIDTGTIKGHHGYGAGKVHRKEHGDGLGQKQRYVYPLAPLVRRRLWTELSRRSLPGVGPGLRLLDAAD